MSPEVAAWAQKDAAIHNAIDWRKAIEEARSETAKEKKEAEEAAAKANNQAPAPPEPPKINEAPEPPKPKPEPVKAQAKEPETAKKAASPPPAAAATTTVAVGSDGDSTDVVLSDEEKGSIWRKALGRQTWFFLHTLAAKYPDYPSDVDQVHSLPA